ncbi:hypothetical protein Gotri_002609 [Gossypium trilobum]|uniref:Uncharacterized protein n=2 Tax=Gossypium TaxID=3633 RepID=A0A7J9F8U3_9ROSI|nr:hypothetical protein [Gossypium trilobum]
MLWYLTHLFHIGIEFHLEDLQYYVTKAIQGEISPEMKNLATFLTWFYPLEQWHEMIGLEYLRNTKAQWIVIIFYKPQYFMQNGPATQLGAFPSTWIHKTYPSEVSRSSCRYRSLQKYLCQINKIILVEIWPSPEILKPWEEDKPLTPYQAQLKQALVEYQTNISDPKEWSQEYPMFCCQKAEGTAKEEKKRKIEELNLTSDTSTDYDADYD